jgi:hypothetical protein
MRLLLDGPDKYITNALAHDAEGNVEAATSPKASRWGVLGSLIHVLGGFDKPGYARVRELLELAARAGSEPSTLLGFETHATHKKALKLITRAEWFAQSAKHLEEEDNQPLDPHSAGEPSTFLVILDPKEPPLSHFLGSVNPDYLHLHELSSHVGIFSMRPHLTTKEAMIVFQPPGARIHQVTLVDITYQPHTSTQHHESDLHTILLGRVFLASKETKQP